MSYEYNAESQRMDFPNPSYVENWFLMATTIVLIAGGISLLVVSRGAMSHGHGMQSMLPLLLGVGLLVTGLRYGRRLLMQLRFFFGRGLPVGLAPELTGDANGRSVQADELKEMLRQNAITYPEPIGPLNGLLYAWIRDLIFAPRPVQYIAQRQFQTGIVIIVTLLSFLVAWLGFSDRQAAAWMGLFYFIFSVVLLLLPIETGATGRANVGMRGLVTLVLVAVFAPVLLPLVSHSLPDIGWLSLEVQTLFLLLASLGSVGLYFRALMNQMTGAPNTNMAREQTSLSMNCHPKQLMDELDRTLQDEWVERIPNRRYVRVLPVVSGGAGAFSAELVEETQPMPAVEQRRLNVATAFALARFRWIAWLDVAGVALIALATLWLVIFGVRLDPTIIEPRLFSLMTLGLAMLTLGSYCLNAGRVLWQRFDFTSRIVWIEMQGNYQAARMDFGNTFTDRVKTEKQIINIETMTLRVWAAELDTVIFGKGATRIVTGLRGTPDFARRMTGHLTDFAGEQSVFVAPTSQADLQKSAVLGALNRTGGAAPETSPAAVAFAAAANVCPSCSTSIDRSDRFCGGCGTALQPA
ncbi:zinc ribbon domain-containing protein [Luteibacter yeojuensis]|uniref:Zinc ribbon domain-containing protein n=2 Tax=Luteibacter yeojuensis TaxID=345309 RepID=A0A7X5QVW3_9GAMM|nr:zinc ribbon domain-containing protein [Luteibacter yeojuensis]